MRKYLLILALAFLSGCGNYNETPEEHARKVQALGTMSNYLNNLNQQNQMQQQQFQTQQMQQDIWRLQQQQNMQRLYP